VFARLSGEESKLINPLAIIKSIGNAPGGIALVQTAPTSLFAHPYRTIAATAAFRYLTSAETAADPRPRNIRESFTFVSN
jgi:hypothetical protein